MGNCLQKDGGGTDGGVGSATTGGNPLCESPKAESAVKKVIQEQLAAAFATYRPTLLKDAAPLRAAMATPNHIHEFKLNVTLSNGEQHAFNAFRVQHNNLLGPYKGGLRFHKMVEIEECTALATWMTMKTALVGLPLGGGKGGVNINTKEHSAEDIERVAREFGRQLAPVIGDTVDVPAPDVGSGPSLMLAMLDEYNKHSGTESPGTFTGKPVDRGGSLWRTQATGYGVAVATRSILGGDVNGKTIAVQGQGNVGFFAAKFLTEWGAKLVATGDSSGYRQADGGLKLPDSPGGGRVKDWKQGVLIELAQFFAVKCDVMIPCALELQIDAGVAKSMNCRYIVEGANGPTTPAGEVVLDSRNIKLVPDILANSGGVIVSYYEWVQNRTGERWAAEKVRTEMEELIVPIVNELRSHKGNSRVFCFHKALGNLEKAFVAAQTK